MRVRKAGYGAGGLHISVAIHEAIREEFRDLFRGTREPVVIAGAAQNHLPEADVRLIEAVEAARNPVHG